MFRYFFVLVIAGGVIYAAQHPEAMRFLDGPPDFKVWIEQTRISPNNARYDILNVQSREEKPIIVKSVLMNDDPKCVNLSNAIPKKDGAPMVLGETQRIGLGLYGVTACNPVKVVISTDRGDSTYRFE
ncbi:hypothetical protein CQ12_29040 [Bradyrhizobium jicamae]|uniref:Uncharacterized protein n=1 Tax=Bradyrhizobium jicamae TaxID=280332 RepID=A0A0R3M8S7_9BRAD|nr:hypothetical protein [Bradyrhizobium jicamae]KRR15998.1 hypothetical protein CQ12_29040 [Bradyrhizobium jicamae]